MKPPPRRRTTLSRNLKPQQSGRLVCKWQRAEQKKLLNALRRLRRTAGDKGDIDISFLREQVSTRSNTEIHSVVESLKNKVISCANLKLKEKRWKEKKVRKPIEVWTHMASNVTGTVEQTISTAFSQMLIVTSTEPRTLKNCDPPEVHRQPAEKNRPVSRTVPLRPMPCLPVKGLCPGTNTTWPLQIFKTPAPTMGPAVRVPNRRILPLQGQISAAVTSNAAISTVQPPVTSCQLGTAKIFDTPFTSSQPLSQSLTPITGRVRPISSSVTVVNTLSINGSMSQQPSEQHNTTSSSHTRVISSPTPDLGTTPSSASCFSSAPSSCTFSRSVSQLSSPAAVFHARFGRTSKYATKDSPRMFGVRCVVDFERIYRYLSVIHKPNEECHLTPMESAVVLDLLMSLPEELSLLDCSKLHTHLIQVYQCLSSSADSKIARELFEDLKDGKNKRTDIHQKAAGTSNSTDVMDSEGRTLQPDEAGSQSSGNSNTFSQSSDTEVTEICPPLPPLNPFRIPVKLLMRKKVKVPISKTNVQ